MSVVKTIIRGENHRISFKLLHRFIDELPEEILESTALIYKGLICLIIKSSLKAPKCVKALPQFF